MQIVCSSSVHKHAEPFLSTLKYMGFDPVVWQPSKKSIYNVCEDLNPSIIIVAPTEVDENFQVVRSRHNFQLVYFGFGRFFIEPEAWCVPQDTPQNIIEKTPNCHEFKKCVDIAKNMGGQHDDDYNYDVVYFSEVDHKNPQINEALISLSTLEQISFIIVGPVKIPIPQYLGTITLKDKATLLASCKIGLDFNLINAFNFALYKKPCIYQAINITQKVINYLESPELREEHGETSYNYIIDNHLTSFEESSKLLDLLGHKELSKLCKEMEVHLLASL